MRTYDSRALVQTLNITEVLGPLGPVAVSPFFGMACLSATSIMVNNGILPENQFLMGNSALNNPAVFLVFALLTVVTSVPKLTSGSKVLAEIGDQAETYVAIISYLTVFVLADFAASPDTQQVVYSAGIISFTKETLLMIAIVANIIVINTVKFFFELLALISPIPLIDAIFEAANKAFAAFLAVVYAFNPYLALVLNIFIFLICLSIFNFCLRRVKYYRGIILGPMFHSLHKKFTGKQKIDTEKRALKKLSQILGNVDFAMKVFPKTKTGKIKKKQLCRLAVKPDEFVLVQPRLIRRPKTFSIAKAGANATVEKGLISNSIIITPAKSEKIHVLIFSKSYSDRLEEINTAISTNH